MIPPILPNLAFPSQLWPELTNFGLWWAGLVIVLVEMAMMKLFNLGAPWLRLIAAVSLANVFSTIAGFVVTSYFFPGMLEALQLGSRYFATHDYLGFAKPFVIVAVLNTALEGSFYATLNQVYPFDRPWAGAAAANVVTAMLLAITVLVRIQPS